MFTQHLLLGVSSEYAGAGRRGTLARHGVLQPSAKYRKAANRLRWPRANSQPSPVPRASKVHQDGKNDQLSAAVYYSF